MPTRYLTVTPKKTFAVTPTYTQLELPPIETRCLQTVPGPAPKFDGRIVLSSPKDEVVPSYMAETLQDTPSSLFDLQTGQSIPLGQTEFETVSPDGSKLAYFDVERERIVITDAGGNMLKEIPAHRRQEFPAYWLDDHRLLINILPLDYRILPSLVVLDLLTGEQQEWKPDYPNINMKSVVIMWGITGRMVVHPALTHVIYPSNAEGSPVILWDIQAKRAVAQVYDSSVRDHPRWSPDGKSFITSAPIQPDAYREPFGNVPYRGGLELWLVSLAGEVRRLTFLTTTRVVSETNFVWSPSGKKIVYYLWEPLSADEDHHPLPPELMVMEVETRKIINYCRLARPSMTDDALPILPPEAVWSPDGKYLLVTQVDENMVYRVFLVDLRDGSTWLIAENVVADGWMASEP